MINKMNKIVIITILFTTLVFAQVSHNVRQLVRNWPVDYDETGVQWMIYDWYNAETHWHDQDTAGAYTLHSSLQNFLRWTGETNVFPDWQNGDMIIAFGSWDSAYATSPSTYGSNPNHTGFYWLFSDTLDASQSLQTWSPDDTLRVMPEPYAYQVGGETGNIRIEIINPAETRRVDQTEYDVMGYWIWADTTSGTHHDTAGRPDYFDLKVGFFSVDGDPGDITICTHSVLIYRGEQTVYWAYKLVARPDTVDAPADTMGYTTYYFSQNSNPLVIIGIEENTNSKPECVKLEISPNPFTDRTDIRFQITENQRQDVRSKNQEASLEIYDCSGRLVKSFDLTSVILLHASAVPWYGTDELGKPLPSGVYFIQAKNGDLNLTKKVILQRK